MAQYMRKWARHVEEDDSCYFIYEDTDEKVADDYVKGYLEEENLYMDPTFTEFLEQPRVERVSVQTNFEKLASKLRPTVSMKHSIGISKNKITCDDQGADPIDSMTTDSSKSLNDTQSKSITHPTPSILYPTYQSLLSQSFA